MNTRREYWLGLPWHFFSEDLVSVHDASALSLPHIGWERADAAGDDGMIRFTNTKGQRVKVIVTRGALQDYPEADDRIQSRKEGQRLTEIELLQFLSPRYATACILTVNG